MVRRQKLKTNRTQNQSGITLPWERSGYQVLGKYPSESPEAGDVLVLQKLLEHGADLKKDRHVVHYFYFGSDHKRDQAVTELTRIGYRINVGTKHSSGNAPYGVTAERTGSVNAQVIANERVLLTHIAAECGGEYDGWEAALD